MKNKNLLTGLLILLGMGFSLTGWSQCAVTVEASDTYVCPEENVMLYAETLPSVLSTFASGNGQNGNMFDITAKNDITITSFDGHIDPGSTIMEIYYKYGTHVGSEYTPGDWTLIGAAPTTSGGMYVPTPIEIPVNVTILTGETYAFYITTTGIGPNVNYTNGTAVGNVYAENDDLQIHEGKGVEYPFYYTYEPRIWNGQVHYTLSPTTYLWNTGDTTAIITVNPIENSLYSVEADMAGCTATGSIQIDVDNTPPVPDLATLPDINDDCLTLIPPTATDNCEGVIVATTTDPLTYTEPGSYVVTWVYDDGYGNITTQTQNVNIGTDVTDPVPDLATLPDIVGQCTVTVPPPTAWDNCDGAIYGTTTDPTSYSVIGTYLITWTYTDSEGNSVSQTQNVEVNSGPDVTPPVPDVIPLPVLTAECELTVTDIPTATDGCEGAVTGTTTDTLFYDLQGTYAITWSYDDGLGNISTQVQTVIIDDITPPVPDLATLPTIYGQCSLTLSTPPTATDNCEGAIVATTNDPLIYQIQGTYTVTWIYDDGNGNISTQDQTVVLSDVFSPTPDVPTLPDLTGECSVTITDLPLAWDNCAGAVYGTNAGAWSFTEQGTYTVVWVYDDGNGNTTTQNQTVIVDDVTGPVPDVATLPDLTGECEVTVVTIPTATDNCEGAITATTEDTLYYDIEGSYVVTWAYNDGNGNITTQEQNVIIDDVTDPVPDLASLPDIVSSCEYTVVTIPTATDNCAGTIVATTTDTLYYDQAGDYIINWVYDDGNGNTVQQDQNITIEDTEAPVPDIADLPVLAGDCSVTLDPPTATDACVGEIVGTTTTLYLDTQGTHTVTWSYDDGNGNVATQTQQVVIADTIPPTADCPDDLVVCDGAVGSIAVEISDNCTDPVVTYELSGATTATGTGSATSETFNEGETTVTYTVDDGNGNSVQCSFIVTNVISPTVTVTETDGVLSTAAEGSYQWINCDGETPVEGATDNSFEPEVSGSYAVIVTDGPCIVTSDCYTVTIIDALGKSLSEDFEIYPNPVNDNLTIELGGINTHLTIVMVNIGGQVVYNQTFDRTDKVDIDVNDFKAGMYMIHISSDQQNGYVNIIKE